MAFHPLISAVVAIYKPDKKYLQQAVSSVLEQTYPVGELIVVNDGDTSTVAKNWLPEDHRIRFFFKENGGIASARNFAIEKSRGEYISFVDQDDYWYPDKLEQQVSLIPPSCRECMVCSTVDIVDEKNNRLEKETRKRQALYDRNFSEYTVSEALLKENIIYSSTPLIHRDIFRKIGGFDPNVQPHDDWDIYLRIALSSYPIHHHKTRPLSTWRAHNLNESKKMPEMIRSRCRVEKKIMTYTENPDIRKALELNYLLDTIERDHWLLFKNQRYRLFRKHILHDLYQLMEYARHTPREHAGNVRIRKTLLKSIRRYVYSCLLNGSQTKG